MLFKSMPIVAFPYLFLFVFFQCNFFLIQTDECSFCEFTMMLVLDDPNQFIRLDQSVCVLQRNFQHIFLYCLICC